MDTTKGRKPKRKPQEPDAVLFSQIAPDFLIPIGKLRQYG